MNHRKPLRHAKMTKATLTPVLGGRITKPSSSLASLSAVIHFKCQRQAPRCDSTKESGACRMDLTLTLRSNWEDSPSWNSPHSMPRSIGQGAAQQLHMGQ